MYIYRIKMSRRRIRTFLFDICYLVPLEAREFLPRLFPYSLCIPITEAVQTHLKRILPSLDCEHVCMTTRVPQKKPQREQLHEALSGFLVVPILPLVHLNKTKPHGPRTLTYLTAPQHRKPTNHAFSACAEQYLTDSAVLFTPEKAYRPMCLACPRHLLHVQGKCALGDRVCYSHFIFRSSLDEQLQAHTVHAD